MGFELIVGAGIIAGICIYMFFKLGENTGNEHIVYQLLLLSLVIGSVIIIGGATLKESTCDLVPVNTTSIGDSVVYQFDEICREPTSTENTFFKLTQWFFRLSMSYIILYLIYRTLMAIGPGLVKQFKKWKDLVDVW